MRFPVALVLAIQIAGFVSAAPETLAQGPAPAADPAHDAVLQALAAGADPLGQARNLTRLAWPAGKRDEAVAAAARRELENFGDHAMAALREAVNSVKIGYTEEVVTTTLGAQRSARTELATEYLAVLLDALWVGSYEAKTLAIRALGADRSPFAVAPMIDCAVADPRLGPLVVETLGKLRYEQARFYLEKVMMEGPAASRPLAASSLAQIRGAALGPLKNALKADNREARVLAARSLLPSATEYDLGAIYEYIEKHGDDDASLTQSLKLSAANIEKAIAARDANAAAGSPQDN